MGVSVSLWYPELSPNGIRCEIGRTKADHKKGIFSQSCDAALNCRESNAVFFEQLCDKAIGLGEHTQKEMLIANAFVLEEVTFFRGPHENPLGFFAQRRISSR